MQAATSSGSRGVIVKGMLGVHVHAFAETAELRHHGGHAITARKAAHRRAGLEHLACDLHARHQRQRRADLVLAAREQHVAEIDAGGGHANP